MVDIGNVVQSALEWPLPVFPAIFGKVTGMKIVSWVAQIAMVLGGVVPYIPQYRQIKRSSSAEGFSTFVCLTLIVANILRIMFWTGKHFELPLLIQSFVMIFTMLAIIRICTIVKKSEIVPSTSKQHTFLDFEWSYFWQWSDFMSYVQCLATFSLVFGIITFLLINVTIYVEILGFLAVFFEALLGLPQFYKNWKNRSTDGMSVKMVLMWTCGDIFKTCYFVLRHAPPQFWICGAIQVSLDLSILIQVVYYGSRLAKFFKPAVQ